MINVREGQRVIETFETFEAAKAYVQRLGVIYMEDDADNDDCADAYLEDDRVIAIEPADFFAREG